MERDGLVRFAARRFDVILTGIDPLLVSSAPHVVPLAARHRIPAIYEWPNQSAAGGLISFGLSRVEANRIVGVAVLTFFLFPGMVRGL